MVEIRIPLFVIAEDTRTSDKGGTGHASKMAAATQNTCLLISSCKADDILQAID